jgi:hypothetical protein
MRKTRNVYKILVGPREGKRLTGRPNREHKDNIKVDLKEIGESVDYFNLVRDRDQWLGVVNTVMDLCIP